MPNSAWDEALEINLALRFPCEPHMGFLSKLEAPGRERQREMVRGPWALLLPPRHPSLCKDRSRAGQRSWSWGNPLHVTRLMLTNFSFHVF